MSALKGSRRIVFETLCNLVLTGQQPSAGLIAYLTGYHECTVKRALVDLRTAGVISYRQERPGQRAIYKIGGTTNEGV